MKFRRHHPALLFAVLFSVLLAGCAGTRQNTASPPDAAPASPASVPF